MSCKRVYLLLPGYALPSALESADSPPTDTESVTGPSAFHFSDDNNRQPWQSQFAAILGVDSSEGKRLPSARLALIGEASDTAPAEHAHEQSRQQPGEFAKSGDSGESGIVRADPIFLKADRDSARLIPADQLALSEADADELLETLNNFVSSDGLTFFKRNASQWFMSGMNAEWLESYPPSFLANRNASTFLPAGESMAAWRRLMTELQMLLHNHPLNVRREASGLMPVNSVWFWGGGPLPLRRSADPDVTIFADHEQATDMARYHDVPYRPLSSLEGSWVNELSATQTLILDTSLVQAWLDNDMTTLVQNLARINHHWLAPLVEQVRAGQLTELTLMTEDGLQGRCDVQSIREMTLRDHRGNWLQSFIRFFKR